MKILGLLLLFSGWGLVMSALALLRAPGPRVAFIATAMVVEALGLAVMFKAHLPARGDRR
jgi:hypothetical protein